MRRAPPRRRIRIFLDAYGDLPPFDVPDAVIASIRSVIARVTGLAQQGVEPQRTWVEDGAVAREEGEIDRIQQHRDLLQA